MSQHLVRRAYVALWETLTLIIQLHLHNAIPSAPASVLPAQGVV